MTVYETVYSLARELALIDRADFNPVRLLAVGCSTSEVGGGTIGRASSPGLGQEIARAVLDAAASVGFAPAFQCCEHLNRALVVEREIAVRFSLPVVFAVPHPKAGGSCASAAYRLMKDPVLVASISADAGMDVGQTLISVSTSTNLDQTNPYGGRLAAAPFSQIPAGEPKGDFFRWPFLK